MFQNFSYKYLLLYPNIHWQYFHFAIWPSWKQRWKKRWNDHILFEFRFLYLNSKFWLFYPKIHLFGNIAILEINLVCPFNVRISFPLSEFQILIVSYSDPLTIFPFCNIATQLTTLVWPFNVRISIPLCEFQILIVASCDPLSIFPFG